jgi:hypothetical protein
MKIAADNTRQDTMTMCEGVVLFGIKVNISLKYNFSRKVFALGITLGNHYPQYPECKLCFEVITFVVDFALVK